MILLCMLSHKLLKSQFMSILQNSNKALNWRSVARDLMKILKLDHGRIYQFSAIPLIPGEKYVSLFYPLGSLNRIYLCLRYCVISSSYGLKLCRVLEFWCPDKFLVSLKIWTRWGIAPTFFKITLLLWIFWEMVSNFTILGFIFET